MFALLNNLFKNKKYKLYYWGGRKNKNAGDIYNVDLMDYFGIKFSRCRKFEKANLISVGSNLDKLAIPSKTKMIITGAGFIFPPKDTDCINRGVEVLALRGRLSKNRMENLLKQPLDDCVLGDPGILVSKIYPQNVSKKYKVGIIPHYVDKIEWNDEKIRLSKNDYKLIDIQQDVRDVVREICECECILSSSLHGLIFADSYNIPNRQLIMSDSVAGGCYKFEDYYSAYNENLPEVIDLRKVAIDNNLIENIINSYVSKDINNVQKNLIKVFDFLKNGN